MTLAAIAVTALPFTASMLTGGLLQTAEHGEDYLCGEIVERGSFDALMAQDGYFRALYTVSQ